ncbi:butyrophilin subfamily 1 member A1-like, partial [Acipenser oxyrinchus oxyrinchus]
GEDAILLCLLSPDTNAEEMEVRWYRELESLVHSYMIHRDVIEAQSEQYRGRTSLSREELKKGNVSLQLREVRSSDEGSYSCCVLSTGMQCAAEIQLKVVGELEVPVTLVSARVGDTVTLPCRLSPLSSAVLMEVRWFREGVKAPVYFYTLQKAMTSVQSEEYRDRTRLFMEELRNGNLSLQLDNTQTSDSGLYKCSVSYNLKEAEAVVELKVAGRLSESFKYFFSFPAASLTFEVPDSPLIVQEGENAILLCLLPPDTNAEEMEVRWYRELKSLVHSHMIHRDVIEAQSEQYKGRTSLSREELKKGNVSLQLRDVRSSDEGSYSCCVLSAGMQCAAEIQLKVVGECSFCFLNTDTPQYRIRNYSSQHACALAVLVGGSGSCSSDQKAGLQDTFKLCFFSVFAQPCLQWRCPRAWCRLSWVRTRCFPAS